ncbi:hypothetical protein SAMN05444515_1045 [Ectothiorhodospira marina]|uniref:Uncharacterized protein n=1 Tax=Ectothiorhodospira marina TaxID=1396821 RepID=A0A1H7IU99_9GAMM|nr:hypothetical protein SAMN05444515_1045 [Ectothiorhodospira marina]
MRKDYARGLNVPSRKPFAESDRLEAEIKQNLGGLGYEC